LVAAKVCKWFTRRNLCGENTYTFKGPIFVIGTLLKLINCKPKLYQVDAEKAISAKENDFFRHEKT